MMTTYNDNGLNALLKSNEKDAVPDFFDELKMFEKHKDKLSEEGKFQVYLNLGNLLCSKPKDQNFDKALEYVLKAENLKDGRSDDFKSKLYFTKGHIYSRKKDASNAKEAFIKHIYYQCKDSSELNHPFPIVGRLTKMKNSFYSFRTINKYFISDLINKEITLSSSKEFNDPFDPPLFKFLDNRREKINTKSFYDINPLIDAYEHIKIRCFVRDIKTAEGKSVLACKNHLMWSHYADSYKGVCIRYKFDSNIQKNQINEKEFINWFDINYVPNLTFEDKGSANTKQLFATKHERWIYENEVRLIHFDRDCDEKFIHIPLNEIGGKVEAVFFGLKCPPHDIKTIESILGNNVEYFKFKNEICSNTDIDNLELIDVERFDKLNYQGEALSHVQLFL